MMRIIAASFLTIACLSAQALTLDVTELRGRGGNLNIAVFNDAGQFPDKKPFLTKVIAVDKAKSVVSVELPLAAGDYAISLYLDENKNGKLDTNILGIPKELFGFSNNPRIRMGAPSYQECEIRVRGGAQKTTVNMNKIL